MDPSGSHVVYPLKKVFQYLQTVTPGNIPQYKSALKLLFDCQLGIPATEAEWKAELSGLNPPRRADKEKRYNALLRWLASVPLAVANTSTIRRHKPGMDHVNGYGMSEEEHQKLMDWCFQADGMRPHEGVAVAAMVMMCHHLGYRQGTRSVCMLVTVMRAGTDTPCVRPRPDDLCKLKFKFQQHDLTDASYAKPVRLMTTVLSTGKGNKVRLIRLLHCIGCLSLGAETKFPPTEAERHLRQVAAQQEPAARPHRAARHAAHPALEHGRAEGPHRG